MCEYLKYLFTKHKLEKSLFYFHCHAMDKQCLLHALIHIHTHTHVCTHIHVPMHTHTHTHTPQMEAGYAKLSAKAIPRRNSKYHHYLGPRLSLSLSLFSPPLQEGTLSRKKSSYSTHTIRSNTRDLVKVGLSIPFWQTSVELLL